MNPKNLSELLPPLPTLSELEQSYTHEEAAHPSAQSGAGPEGAARKVEVVTLTDEEFEATLRGAVPTAHTDLSVTQAAAKVVAAAAGDATSTGSLLEIPAAPEPATAETSRFGEGDLLCYAAAAALRYTYRLDALTPVLCGPDTTTLPPYKDLRGGECGAVFAYLTGRSEIVKDARGMARWALRDDERRKALKVLIEGGNVSAALEQARADASAESHRSARAETAGEQTPEEAAEEARDGASRVEEMLWKYLGGQAPPLEQQDSRELLLSQRVVSWLHNLTPELQVPSPESVARQLARETLLQPFRHLTGEWKDGVFVSYFKGREEELKHLYDYLSVLPPQSFQHRLTRAVTGFMGSAWSYITGNAANRPLLIHGPGGVGKSTLLAKFLLDHLLEVPPANRFPYAYLDFDVSALNVSEPVTLIAEAARQLGAQYPSLRPEWEAARADWLKAISANWPQQLAPQQRVEALQRFADLLGRSESEETRVREQFERGLPFLLVMDTFEEVQYHDRDAVKHVFRFLNEFREHVPALRVILMGRAPLKDVRAEYAELESIALEGDIFGTGAATDFSVVEVELGDLATSKAREYLQEQGVADTELAEDLIEVVGGNPLSLRLIARVLREGEVNLGSLREEMQWRPSISDRLLGRKLPPKALLQGVLFRRILGHIHSEKIRDLAHPGLVLRRITPALIKEVLAGPCGLGTLDDRQAEAYFDALAKEVSLVGTDTDAEGSGALKHRVELRRIMLKLMEADEEKQNQIQQVHLNAVSYYSKGEGHAARVEALYHRLMLGDLPRPEGPLDDVPTEEAVEAGYAAAPSPENDPRPVWRAVAEASGELPATANTYLSARLHKEMVPDAAWETADVSDWELSILSRTSRRAREHASVVSALEALRRDWVKLEKFAARGRHRSPLPLIEVALLERLGRYDEALKHALAALKTLKPELKHLRDGEESPLHRRVMEYNLLLARAAAHKSDSAYVKHLIEASQAAGKLSGGKSPMAHTETTRRCLRRLLRFAADCAKSAPSHEALTCTSTTLFQLAYADGLKNSPVLARYAASTAFAQKPEPGLLVEGGKELFPVLLSRMPQTTVSRVAEALARLIQETLKDREGAEALMKLLKTQLPHEPLATRDYWRKQLYQHPDKVSAMLTGLVRVSRVSEARLADMFKALAPERSKSGEDPFEEARRAGDLIPGEGPSAVENAAPRKAKKKR
ncbi:MAG TPA: ATP-binding protein [Pyrinomonadaceae bacterium]